MIIIYLEKKEYIKKHNKYEAYYLNLSFYPDYKDSKFYLEISTYYYNKLLFVNNNFFFCLANNYIGFYKISDQNFSYINGREMDIDSSNCEIIDLNSFYCLKDDKQIVLLSKNNLNISKTIKINSSILGFLNISNKIVSLFLNEEKLSYQNYDILFDGTKWKLNKEKNISNEKFTNWRKSHNYIIFTKDSYLDKKYALLEITTKKSDEAKEITKQSELSN